MRRERLDHFLQWCRGWHPPWTHRSKGQAIAYLPIAFLLLAGLAGSGIDYGSIVIESSRLQNSLDSASLAGARALVTSTGSTPAARNGDGEASAVAFLTKNYYTAGILGSDVVVGAETCKTATNAPAASVFIFCKSASETGGSNDTMRITGTIVRPTLFWKAIGISSTTLSQAATAVASGGMVDVMLSLDLTRSMAVSGDTDPDLISLRRAVDAFLYQMQLSMGDPRASQVGIARWAGTSCSWNRGIPRPPAQTRTPIPVPTPNADTVIDWNRNEYTLPCYDDASVLSFLSQNLGTLLRIAATSTPVAGSTCPTTVAAPATPNAYSPASMSSYACPLHSWNKPIGSIPITTGTPVAATSMNGDTWDGITGTKLSNALKIVNGNITGCYAWASSVTGCPTNGRNGIGSEGQARKVLVIMTDGFSQLYNTGLPSNYPTYTSASTPVASYSAPNSWNYEAIDLASQLKKGPDGTIGTVDDVEIYVIGFFCVDYDAADTLTNHCRSRAADYGEITSAGNTHPCPAATMPISSRFSYTASSVTPGVDEILNKISSSSPNTCDHYFPISKDEGTKLPQLFQIIAGSIARGRLQ